MLGATCPASVLVVDDDTDSCLLLAELIRLLRPHATVSTANDGAEGLALAVRNRPSVVILDLEMPILDGVSSAACIRQALGREAPVLVALSGSPAMLENPAHRASFDHCFLKPIAIADLLAALGGSE